MIMEEQLRFLFRYMEAQKIGDKRQVEQIHKEAKEAGYEILSSTKLVEV